MSITIEQRIEIKKLCKYLNVMVDGDIDYLTSDEADEIILALKREKHEYEKQNKCKVIDFFKYYKGGL